MRRLIIGIADGIMKVDGKVDLRSQGSARRLVQRRSRGRDGLSAAIARPGQAAGAITPRFLMPDTCRSMRTS